MDEWLIADDEFETRLRSKKREKREKREKQASGELETVLQYVTIIRRDGVRAPNNHSVNDSKHASDPRQIPAGRVLSEIRAGDTQHHATSNLQRSHPICK